MAFGWKSLEADRGMENEEAKQKSTKKLNYGGEKKTSQKVGVIAVGEGKLEVKVAHSAQDWRRVNG